MTTKGTGGVAALTAIHGELQAMPVSFAQRRFWVLDQLDDEAAYTMPAGLRLSGIFNRSALERSLNFIVARHESLRTVFAVEGEEPVQVVLPQLHIPLPMEDLSHLSTELGEAAVRSRANANSNAPFDISAGPLIRASLLRFSEREHVLLLSLHHIVADGWSMGIIFDELEAAYTAYVGEGEPSLAPLPLQYPDYAVWQRRSLQGANATRQLAYWQDRLRDLTPLELPTDFARPAVQTLNGNQHELLIGPDVAEGIRSLARRQGATPFVGFLSVFFVLLHRYSGQSDIVVGSLTSGRRRPEVEPLVGLFLNTLAIRATVASDAPFLDFLRNVRESATSAYANQDVPFEQVVDAVQPARDRSRSPVFQVAFQLLETLGRDIRLPGLTASRVSGSKHSAKFELTLTLHAAPHGALRAVLEYNADLFDGETIKHMLGHYANLLASVVRDAGATVARLPLMDAEAYSLTANVAASTAVAPPSWTLPERILQQAAQTPDAVAVKGVDGTLSYGELARRSAALSQQLVQLGVGAGQRVAVCMERTTAMVVALLAVLRTGAAYVPLDGTHPSERLAHVLSDADVSALLADSATLARVPAVTCPLLLANEFAMGQSILTAEAFAAPRLSAEAPAYAIYTSGSTGKPKGVVIPHRALSNFLASMAERPGLQASDAVVAVTTVAFDIAGLELFLPLTTGARVELASYAVASDGVALRTLIEATCASTSISSGRTLVQATPATWTMLLESGWAGAPNIVVLCGGEAWPPTLAASLLPRSAALWNVYGPTETTIWSARYHVTHADQLQLGEPLANTSLLVLEPTGDPAPPGVPGELWIGGDGLAIGYHNRPDLTAEKFVQHPRFGRIYRTGDRARRTAQGALLYMGRLDDQIKLRGYRIELGEIESVLAALPGVAQCVVALRRDGGEPRLVGYVVFAPGNGDEALRIAALVEPMRRALPEYMVPSAVMAVEKLPLSPAGKVDRRALPAPPEDTVLVSSEFVAPRTEAEEQIAAVWSAVLGRERIGVHDDFFALGGHSLLAMRVVARLADVFPIRLTIGMLFTARTVAALGVLVDASNAAGATATRVDRIAPRAHNEPAPLSYAQELVWLYEQLKPGTAAYHIPMARRVRGPIDAHALERAVGRLVARHESLRTSFVEHNGAVSQVIGDPTPCSIEQHDLRSVEPNVRAEESERLLRKAALRPFNLSAPSTPRVALVILTDSEALLLVVVHHVVFDGASAGVFMSELAIAYSAELADSAVNFAPLPIQLADYAAWERRELTGARLDPELAFWREELQGAPSTIELPTDFAPSANVVGPGGRYQTTLPAETHSAIRTVAKALEVTPFVVLMTAFQAVLCRYSGQSDIVVGTAVAGRERAGTAGLIGYLSNTLAIRGQFEPDATFADMLCQVQSRMLRALDHQDVPYEKIVRDLRAGLPSGEQTLFRVMFTMQDSDVKVPKLGDAIIEPLGVDLGAAKFDLTVSAAELPHGVELVVEYRSDLFRRETIARMFEHLNVILTDGCRSPEKRVARLEILDDRERQQLALWNDTSVAYPPDATLESLFLKQVAATPEARAVADPNRVLSYRELDWEATELAHRLRGAGATTGSLVGVLADRSVGMVVALLAIHKAGAAYVPFDPEYPAERLRFMIADAATSVVVADRSALKALPDVVPAGVATVLLSESDSQRMVGNAPLPSPAPDDLAYMIYTSGSTGRPKGALNTHRGIVNRLLWMQDEYRLGANDVVLQKTPFSFDVSVWEFFWPLITGASLYMARPGGHRDPTYLTETIVAEKVTVCHFVPAMMTAFLADNASERCETLRDVMASGEVLFPDLVRQFARRLPRARLHNLYGPTECAVDVSYWPCPMSGPELESLATVPIGRPVANTRLYVLDALRQPTPIGIAGELYLAGAQVGAGYHRRPELTAERFVPELFAGAPAGEHRMYRSGDRARWRSDGTVEYLGRLDFQIKLRGFRIELGEIESTILTQGPISQAVVVVRDEATNPRLVAYVVQSTASDCSKAATTSLLEFLRQSLPEHMVPSVVVTLDALPLTPSGKVDRRALPAPTDEATNAGQEHIAPRTPLEASIAAVWSEVLGRERVGVEDDFFNIGGHSLLAMRVIGRLSEVLPVRLTISALFEARTVSNLAAMAMHNLAAQEAAATSDSELEALLASLEDLSDEDAARLLSAETPEGR